jgi:hypothetical protein
MTDLPSLRYALRADFLRFPAYPRITSSRRRGIVHADPAGPLLRSTTVGPDRDSAAFTHI